LPLLARNDGNIVIAGSVMDYPAADFALVRCNYG
jgi:hypothetical protein